MKKVKHILIDKNYPNAELSKKLKDWHVAFDNIHSAVRTRVRIEVCNPVRWPYNSDII